jgi:SAM-dependent methyltransferase
VSKVHDDSSRASKDPTRGGAKEPGDVKDVKKVPDGATPRRVRPTGPRERSGPIGITSGDFATPMVRKRTTTQPRGIPVLGAPAPTSSPSLDEPVTASVDTVPAEFEDQATPAPEPVPAPSPAAVVGAVPSSDALDAIPVAMPVRPPPPPLPGDDDPFAGGAPARVDIDAEAALLAAEAAAVRALDSGPLTPPPEVLPAPKTPAAESAPETPTPPPEVTAPETPPPEVAPTRTPPPQVFAAAPTPAPEVVAAVPTPPPEVVPAPRTPPPEAPVTRTPPPEITVTRTPPPEAVVATKPPPPDITIIRTPPPELVAATRTPVPEPMAAHATPSTRSDDYSSPIAAAAAAVAEASADQATPPPEPKPVPSFASEANGAGLAVPATPADGGLENLPAAALSEAEGVDPSVVAGLEGELDADEHVEMMDGTDEGEDASPADQAKSLRTPTLKNAAPPPIPGSHLRTPGPELIIPAVADAVVAAGLPPILPEALAQRPRRPKRSKPWFEEVFDEDYLRTLPFMRPDQTLREVEFISDALRVGPAAEILDIACGYGRHAIELVQRGYNVTGLDLSLPLLIRAADEAQRRALSVNFVHADMREMAFEKQFDGAYSMLTSFGYFDEDTNLRVAERIGRALKPGARFLLDIVNRDYVVSDLPVRVWWEGTGCVVLEEVDFNFHTSRVVTHRSIVFEDGRQLEQEISVRAYSLHEIGRLLRQAGFRVMDVSGGLNTRGQFFGNVSRSLLIVAEKRDSDAAQPL